MIQEKKDFDKIVKKEWKQPIISKLSVIETLGSTTKNGTESNTWAQNGSSLVPS